MFWKRFLKGVDSPWLLRSLCVVSACMCISMAVHHCAEWTLPVLPRGGDEGSACPSEGPDSSFSPTLSVTAFSPLAHALDTWDPRTHFPMTLYKMTLYRKDLHDPDNHNGVITHLEPDVLECKVKWALGSITRNRASGRDRIPVELLQILKDDAVKVLHSKCQQIWKLSSGHRTGKGQFSFQSQRKAVPKNVQTTTQLHSSHTLAK